MVGHVNIMETLHNTAGVRFGEMRADRSGEQSWQYSLLMVVHNTKKMVVGVGPSPIEAYEALVVAVARFAVERGVLQPGVLQA